MAPSVRCLTNANSYPDMAAAVLAAFEIDDDQEPATADLDGIVDEFVSDLSRKWQAWA